MIEALEDRRLLSAPWAPTVHSTQALRRRGWTVIQGKTIQAGPRHEALELDHGYKVIYRHDTLVGGSTSARVLDSRYIIFEDDLFLGAYGTPDPDGHDLQFVRTGDALVRRCELQANPNHTEDGINVFSDVPVPGSVWVEDSIITGHGPTSSGCGICLDGPTPPPLILDHDTITGARCAVTIAAGAASVTHMTFADCGVDVYAAALYGRPVSVGYDGTGALLGAGAVIHFELQQ